MVLTYILLLLIYSFLSHTTGYVAQYNFPLISSIVNARGFWAIWAIFFTYFRFITQIAQIPQRFLGIGGF